MPRYDIYTDPSGSNDIVLDENCEWQFTKTVRESLSQRIEMVLNIMQGEWDYDTSFGFPMRQTFSGTLLTKSQKDAEVVRIISELEDVTSIKNLVSTIDNYTRKYTVERVDIYCNDELLEIPVNSSKIRTNIYPDPKVFEDFQVCYTPEILEEANSLYYLLNYQMGIVGLKEGEEGIGSSTWWNTWGGGFNPRFGLNNLDTPNNYYKNVNQDMSQGESNTWWNDWVN